MEDFRLEGPACARRSNERPRATLVRDRRLGVRGSNTKGARSKATTPAPPPPVDWLADDAVSCELVSAPNSLLTGKLTGNFANSGPQQRFPHLINEPIQRLAAKFPTQRNREFPNAYQGIFSGITGNLIERAAKALSCCRTSN